MQLYEISNEKQFHKISKELMKLENDTYNPAHFNWPDKRVSPMVFNESKWCHGACGIGLSRAGLLKIKSFQNDKNLINDLSMSLKASNIYWPSHNITLCCGSIGNIELLNSVNELLNTTENHNNVQIRLYEILKNYDELSLMTWGINGEPHNLGFFQGISGVGYSLMRINDKSLPNIALFE
jgi:lantibiotic modifying enzyme